MIGGGINAENLIVNKIIVSARFLGMSLCCSCILLFSIGFLLLP